MRKQVWQNLWAAAAIAAASLVLAGCVLMVDPQTANRRALEETDAAARVSALMTNLQTIRSQLLIYKAQHKEKLPGPTPEDFVRQLTQYTDAAGNTAANRDAEHPHGPYLLAIPRNPISGSAEVRIVGGAATKFMPPAKDGGWWFNPAREEFYADLADSHVTPDGRKMNGL
ncbi:MAG: hypothetical protein QF662_02905 [Phycisphaerae bacterium]|nr:hypothetical protein [Phycisphaerae bacterium]